MGVDSNVSGCYLHVGLSINGNALSFLNWRIAECAVSLFHLYSHESQTWHEHMLVLINKHLEFYMLTFLSGNFPA